MFCAMFMGCSIYIQLFMMIQYPFPLISPRKQIEIKVKLYREHMSMPKQRPSLTDTLVKKLESRTSTYEVRDGALKGFYIRVYPTGTKSYRCEYKKISTIPVAIQDARFIAKIFVPRESIFYEQYLDIVSEKCFSLEQILKIENRSLDGGGYIPVAIQNAKKVCSQIPIMIKYDYGKIIQQNKASSLNQAT